MSKCDESLITRVLITYARALDTRRWELLAEVFTPDVTANYADTVFLCGLDSLTNMVSSVLGPCGPTQHLLGNFEVSVSGEHAELECAVRAYHADADVDRGRHYELFGTYWARLDSLAAGWRIAEFRESPILELGSYEVLGEYVADGAIDGSLPS